MKLLTCCGFFYFWLVAQGAVAAAEASDLGVNQTRLSEFAALAFRDSDLWRTDSVLIQYRGKLIFEKYAHGYTAEMRHLSWSMDKSFTAILFGISESRGLINRNDNLRKYFGDLTSDPKQLAMMDKVTLLDELTMSSGRQWIESYTFAGVVHSDAVRMLYLDGYGDMGRFTASHPLAISPGDYFQYNTGNYNVVMAALKKALRDSYATFPWTALFDPIGMSHVVLERDPSGTFDGGSHLYATPRDFLRFGNLLLHRGHWENVQVVPEEWIQTCIRLSPALEGGKIEPNTFKKYNKTYGAGFWLNRPAPKWQIRQPDPDLPEDSYSALGHEGQRIVIVPSRDLVVVRTAHDHDSAEDADFKKDWGPFFRALMAALPVDGGAK